MKVQLLDRKGIPSESVRSGRVSFEDGLRTSTVLILTCPKTPETTNLISHAELSLMPPSSILINVARGGVVDEEALVQALREDKIAGAAADVFLVEPATPENSPLVRASGEEWCQGKTVLSTHVAWCAQSSIDKLRGTVRDNVEGWARGERVNVVV
jgi:phosphoglycerate dehydrogenase-like enzyme